MATTSSSSVLAMSLTSLGHPLLEKLTRENYLVWRAQVLPVVRGAQLTSYLDGSKQKPSEMFTVEKAEVDNPDYVQWIAQDQRVLGYLLLALLREVLVQVVHLESVSEVWRAIGEMFSSQSKARIIQICSQLSREQKGDSTVTAHFTKMKGLADEMAVAGKKLDDDDVVSYILAGLDADYNAFVSSISAKDTVSLSDLYAQLLAYEARLNLQSDGGYQSSANVVSRGGRGCGQGRGRERGHGRGRGGRGRGDGPRPTCQLCGKEGHTVHSCWKRFDCSFTGDDGAFQKTAAVVSSYGVDTNWYTDIGATNHISSELEKLTTREKYHGHNQIHAANGAGNEENSSPR